MEYTSLYRKYRPLTFSEIEGQEHITKTLKNEIIAGRIGHAYLFNGGRGTGKTSAAKVLARAVNCLNPHDGEPCNECKICKAALDGSLTDIVEMDAASNNSVDDIRAIRDEVNFLPTLAKYRVYIIDEVHMLSAGAFNALLKTLEEPPAHVKFILATTEPQKLPSTILSRCQRFDFKKISNASIIKRLNYVCETSKIDITPEAIATIAVLAEGGMRDALSILERCMQEDTKITEEIVKELVGIPKLTNISKITQNIIDQNTEEALKTINEVLNDGKDIECFLWEITKYIRDILVFKSQGELLIYSNEEKEQIKQISEKVSKEQLVTMIYQLSDLANQMKWSSQKLIMFQVTIIKMCNRNNSANTSNIVPSVAQNAAPVIATSNPIVPATSSVNNNEINELKFKISQLEKEMKLIENTGIRGNSSGMNNRASNIRESISPKAESKKKVSQEPVIEGKELSSWPTIVQNIRNTNKMSIFTSLVNSKAIEINDMTVGIKGLNPVGKTILEQSENMTELTKQVSLELGKPMRVKLIDNETSIDTNASSVQGMPNISKELDIPINIIDD